MSTSSSSKELYHPEPRDLLIQQMDSNNLQIEQGIAELTEAQETSSEHTNTVKNKIEENERIRSILSGKRDDQTSELSLDIAKVVAENKNIEISSKDGVGCLSTDAESQRETLQKTLESNTEDILISLAIIREKSRLAEEKAAFIERKLRDNDSLEQQLKVKEIENQSTLLTEELNTSKNVEEVETLEQLTQFSKRFECEKVAEEQDDLVIKENDVNAFSEPTKLGENSTSFQIDISTDDCIQSLVEKVENPNETKSDTIDQSTIAKDLVANEKQESSASVTVPKKKSKKEWRLEKAKRAQEEQQKQELEQKARKNQQLSLEPIMWCRLGSFFAFLTHHQFSDKIEPVQNFRGKIQHEILAFPQTSYYQKRGSQIDWLNFVKNRMKKLEKDFQKTAVYTVLLEAADPKYPCENLAIETICYFTQFEKDVRQLEHLENEFLLAIEDVHNRYIIIGLDEYMRAQAAFLRNEAMTERQQNMLLWKNGLITLYGQPESDEKYNKTKFFESRLNFYIKNTIKGRPYNEYFCIYMFLSNQGPDNSLLNLDFHLLAEGHKRAEDETWIFKKEQEFFDSVFRFTKRDSEVQP